MKLLEYALGILIGILIAVAIAALLFGCVDVEGAVDKAADKCEEIVREAQEQTAADCQELVEDQVSAGRAWLEELARSLGCVQIVDPVEGLTSEWDCSAVCESAPDSVTIP